MNSTVITRNVNARALLIPHHLVNYLYPEKNEVFVLLQLILGNPTVVGIIYM